MMGLRFIAAFSIMIGLAAPSFAGIFSRAKYRSKYARVSCNLHGQLLDLTHNHGADRRIYSTALCSKRDLYVYLPPQYDGVRYFPVMIYFHGLGQDEKSIIEAIELLDQMMVCGTLPPMVIAIPDGTKKGDLSARPNGSFFLNTPRCGNFEDFVIQDVWPFIQTHFLIRPEKEAHILMGASMGGLSAMNLGIKYRETFQVVVGILPLVNWRYQDCHGRLFADFDPNCLGWREHYKPRQVTGFVGMIPIRTRFAIRPMYGRKDAEIYVPLENPIEMIESYNLGPGELKIFFGYTRTDSFNVDAQVESFVFVAAQRGIHVDTFKLCHGKHRAETGKVLMGPAGAWLNEVLRPYVPR